MARLSTRDGRSLEDEEGLSGVSARNENKRPARCDGEGRMQARDMLLLDGRVKSGRLECTDGKVGVERFDEATYHDKRVGVSSGLDGCDCA